MHIFFVFASKLKENQHSTPGSLRSRAARLPSIPGRTHKKNSGKEFWLEHVNDSQRLRMEAVLKSGAPSVDPFLIPPSTQQQGEHLVSGWLQSFNVL